MLGLHGGLGTWRLEERRAGDGRQPGPGRGAGARRWRRRARGWCWWRGSPSRWRTWWPGHPRRAAARPTRSSADVADKEAIARHRRAGGGAGRPDRSAGQQRQHAGAHAAAAAARHRLRGPRAGAGGQPGGAVPADQGVAGSMALRGRGLDRRTSRSDAAIEPYPRWGAYGASKAALEQLGRDLGGRARGHGRARPDRRSRRDGHPHARRGDPRRRSGLAGRSGPGGRADRRADPR